MIKPPLVIPRTGDVENAPGNALPAFESTIAHGADGVELDVHALADGELVVHHSHNLGMTDNGTGLVSEHSLAELRALDVGIWFDARFAGEWMPTLAEAFDLCRGRIQLEVALKGSSLGFLQKVIREVEQFELVDDVELTTAHYPLLVHVKRFNSRLRPGKMPHPKSRPPAGWPASLPRRSVNENGITLMTGCIPLRPAAFANRGISLEVYSATLKPSPLGCRCRGTVVQPKGHTNRLKMLKRQKYGRAGFELLRQRVQNRV